ncbi:MAG: protoheme IX farnesyltransferase [Flammeovirgaceae bacterium]|nr:protoheme IX farnesyltransferase [Flammeovirgaceae bacterium]|tara:strand:- start:472 stop:1368 length:897 start_codon:yes stop_codon:yes gene_type:complete
MNLIISKTIFALYMIIENIKIFFELSKFRLSLLVSLSSVFGFLISSKSVDINEVFILLIAGYLVSSSSVINNQIFERDLDKLMERTKKRPIPTDRVSIKKSIIISFTSMIVGLSLISYYLNIYAALLSLISLILYSFVYTPMKKIGPIAVFIGAIPGALPPLIGWVASTGQITLEAIIIFSIQFIWQFPHFWAIAWMYDDDYKKAGFKLLPNNGEKNMKTAVNIMIYTLFLIPLGLLPTIFGITGIISGAVAVLLAIIFLAQTFKLINDYSRDSALKVMFSSFIYLPIVQISYVLDKI